MATDGEKTARDVKNHLLFEVATEVAHRGLSAPPNAVILLFQAML